MSNTRSVHSYLSLDINERINLKSHQDLPLFYFWKNNMLSSDVEETFQLIYETPVSYMLKNPENPSIWFGMTAVPEWERQLARLAGCKLNDWHR